MEKVSAVGSYGIVPTELICLFGYFVKTLPHKTLVQLSKARGTVQSEVKARPVKS